MFDFKNKVAIVTGAASGIGLAYVKELLRRGSKAVALVDINSENGMIVVDEIRSEFKRINSVIFIKADVSDKKQLQNAFDIVINTYNQLDILVNNAGIMQERYWEKCVAVNLTAVITGTMLAMETYFPKYKSESESLIINTASIACYTTGDEVPVYVATKSGIIGFSISIGGKRRYKISNTKVVTICPGHVETALMNITEDHILEPYLFAARNASKDKPSQKPEEFAKLALDVVASASTGSVWSVTLKGCNKEEPPFKYY